MEPSLPGGHMESIELPKKGQVKGDTAADLLIERIIQWGVDVVFGLPGDGINGLMEALRKRQDRIRFIQVRHEESAAFMACAYGKYTGKLGCCLATSGPGAIHLLNGLYDAKMDHSPVLALTGMTYHDLIGTFYQQDVNTEILFRDVADYDERVMGAKDVTALTDLACRTALSHRAVSHLTFPVDLQDAPAPDGGVSPHAGWGHTGGPFACPLVVPADSDLQRAAKILNDGKKIAILVGQGALGAGDEVEELAERLGAPVAKALLGKGVIPDTSPYATGGIGLLGTRPSEDMMDECDTLLMIGTSFPYMNYLPKPGQAKAVQIDADPARLGLRYPVDLGLVGHALPTLKALLPLVEHHNDRGFLKKIQGEIADWWKTMEVRGTSNDKPIHPQVVARHLGELLDDNAIVSSDSGTITTWIARQWKLKKGQMFSLSGNLATMAPGLPYTIAAKVAYPDRQCVGFVGDGGFTMLMGDFVTAVKYKLPIVIVIIKNDVLGQIKWEQMVFLGNPEYGVQLQPIDFAKYAEACGGVGIHVEDPTQVRPALEKALSAGKPAVVEVVTDQFEAPLPPKIHLDQAVEFARAMARGEPNRNRIALTLYRDRVDELLRR
ncbi:MAG: thiamine pyrophosphate-binding protein [Chloroflexi bacterium]|nr:thiamine pyrophosphate-binding protein [Chloroflexota bacterium]